MAKFTNFDDLKDHNIYKVIHDPINTEVHIFSQDYKAYENTDHVYLYCIKELDKIFLN